ncbi:MAG: hypothetical protein R3E10_02945 [Gemmatimonadota bacterium]
MQGERDRAVCPTCGRTFVRVREGRRIRILDAAGKVENALVQTLVGDIERLGGSLTTARQEDGRVEYSARVAVRRSLSEDPVEHEGRLLGYIERLGEPEQGTLTITEDALRFQPDVGDAAAWALMDLGAVQTSSAALQISPLRAPVVEFRFLGDSPFRWEDLLRTLLTEAYRREGRGEIIEFQPRIVAA